MTIAPPPPPPAPLAAADCRPAALRLTLDGGDGDFSGMSHSGVLVVLRNRGARACRVAGLPQVAALDAVGAVLPVSRQTPPGMHPGPGVLPSRIAPGAEVSAPLRWVTGPVFDRSRCFTPATLRLTVGRAVLKAPWIGGQVCGEAGRPATFQQPVLRPGRGTGAPQVR